MDIGLSAPNRASWNLAESRRRARVEMAKTPGFVKAIREMRFLQVDRLNARNDWQALAGFC